MNTDQLFTSIDSLQHEKSMGQKDSTEALIEFKEKLLPKIKQVPFEDLLGLFTSIKERIDYFEIHNLKKGPDDFSPLLAAFAKIVDLFKTRFLKWIGKLEDTKEPIVKIDEFLKNLPSTLARILADRIKEEDGQGAPFSFALALIYMKAAEE